MINLPARQDRRAEIDAQLHRVGLGVGHDLVHLFPAIRPDTPAGFESIGTRGCFLSHLGVLRSAAEDKLDRILVFEDDLNFAADFGARIASVIEALKRMDWAIFYGGCELPSGFRAQPAGVLSTLPASLAVRTAHFIGFRGSTIQSMVRYLEAILSRPPGDPNGGPMHVDGAYNWYRKEHQDEQTALVVPELGYQRSSRTDIHDLHWYDRLVLVREVVALSRRSRNLLRRA